MDELALLERFKRLEAQVQLLSDRLGVPWQEGPGSGVPPEVARLAADGNRLQATKLYVEMTGASLIDAKRVVDGL